MLPSVTSFMLYIYLKSISCAMCPFCNLISKILHPVVQFNSTKIIPNHPLAAVLSVPKFQVYFIYIAHGREGNLPSFILQNSLTLSFLLSVTFSLATHFSPPGTITADATRHQISSTPGGRMRVICISFST